METWRLAADSPWRWWSGFPVAFVLTCVIEVPAYLAAFGALGWCRRERESPSRPASGLGVPRALALGLAVNLVSHPVLWAVARRLPSGWILGLAEVGVAALEGLVVFGVVRRLRLVDSTTHRLLWSLAAAVVVNALSVLVGVTVLPVVIGG